MNFMKVMYYSVKLVVILLIASLLVGCATGMRAYQRGDYYRASIQAVNKLRSNPDKQKAKDALRLAYPLAVENALRIVDNAHVSKDTYQLDRTITIFEEMNKLAQEIYTCPAALMIVPNPREFHEELSLSKQMMAEIFYNEGVKALSNGTIEQSRIAFQKFVKVREYAPGFKDVNDKLEKARYAATLRVVVLKPATNSSYKLSADFFYNKLMEDITRRTFKNFVKFYTPEEAHALKMNNPHEWLLLNFEDFSVGNTREVTDNYELKKENVVVSTRRNPNGQYENVYGTVKARYTYHRLEIMSRGILSVRILEPNTSRVVRHRNFTGQSVWSCEWGTFNGDERALSSEQLELAKKRPSPLPPPQELFASFANPLYADAARYIASMY